MHSLLAYAGLLAGAVTVADAWADPAVRGAAERLAADDLVPTLPGLDTDAYRAALDARWSNPRMMHRLDQIATDGSQKLPARFAAPARARLADGEPPRWIALALAAWARHLETGDVRDPGAAPVREALARATGTTQRAAAVLAPFGDALADIGAAARARRRLARPPRRRRRRRARVASGNAPGRRILRTVR